VESRRAHAQVAAPLPSVGFSDKPIDAGWNLPRIPVNGGGPTGAGRRHCDLRMDLDKSAHVPSPAHRRGVTVVRDLAIGEISPCDELLNTFGFIALALDQELRFP